MRVGSGVEHDNNCPSMRMEYFIRMLGCSMLKSRKYLETYDDQIDRKRLETFNSF